jgi:hypothetical protein
MMLSLIANSIPKLSESGGLIPASDPRGILCVAGLVYIVVIFLISKMDGFNGWLRAVTLSVACFFLFMPVKDDDLMAKTSTGWRTVADINRGVLGEAETKKFWEEENYYYAMHINGLSWKLYHPIMWIGCPIIALSFSGFTWMALMLLYSLSPKEKS